MDETCFDLLCKGMSAEEAKLFRKMLAEWCDGDENSFPVQLVLLTCAQWRAAAGMPLTLQKIFAAFEAKLTDHQKQMTALMITLGRAGDDKIKAFEETVVTHTETMEKVAAKNCDHLDETEKFAHEIRGQMEYGLRESDRITKAMIEERHRLAETQHRYDRSMEWREVFNRFGAYAIAILSGILIGYCLHR